MLILSSQVENFTVSFGDGRVLCHLIHHYHPALLPREMFKLQTMVTLADGTDNNRSHNNSLTGSFSQDPFATGKFTSLIALSHITILDCYRRPFMYDNVLFAILYSIGWLSFMVFNATFNNISVISWRSVLFVCVFPSLPFRIG